MFIKNGRIIINDDSLENDIEQLKQILQNFFKDDERFSIYDITVDVEVDYDAPSGCELLICAYNCDIKEMLANRVVNERARAKVWFSTYTQVPHLVISDGIPEFYFVFELQQFTITDSQSWQRVESGERDGSSVEEIIIDYISCLGDASKGGAI